MRILHIGLMVNKSLNIGLSRELRQIADEYEEIELNQNTSRNISRLNFKPHLVFLQIQSDQIAGRSTAGELNVYLRKMRTEGAFVINWTGDKRAQCPPWMSKMDVDLTCFSNWDDVRSFKYKSDFLQIGIDQEVFHDHHKRQDIYARHDWVKYHKPKDVIFMGNYNGQFPLANYRKSVVSSLGNRKDISLEVYGNGYKEAKINTNASADDPFRMQALEAYLYSKAKIAISVSNFNSDGYYSDRLLRAMGSGVMVLSHAYKGVERDWEIGKDLDVFTDLNSLNDQVSRYMINNDARNKIAITGYKNVHENYTYTDMANNIVRLFFQHRD